MKRECFASSCVAFIISLIDSLESTICLSMTIWLVLNDWVSQRLFVNWHCRTHQSYDRVRFYFQFCNEIDEAFNVDC